MPLPRRFAAACLAIGVLAVSVPAHADSDGARLRRERAHAARLDTRAHHQAVATRRIRHRIVVLNARANTALADLQSARMAQDAARETMRTAARDLTRAEEQTTSARATLANLAANAYRALAGGGDLGTTLQLIDTGDPQTFLEGVQVLNEIGDRQATAVEDLQAAQAEQARAAQTAAQAAEAAAQATRRAAVAREHVSALVAAQHRQLAAEQRLLRHTRANARAAHARARHLARAIATARARAAAIRRAQARAAAWSRTHGGDVARCDGGSVSGFPNGRLPVVALCPLWGAPGAMLRADAAHGFNRMSQAFAHAFDEPLCVTASYRPYWKQVLLYRTMPAGMAAYPGTSNHGWGLAVDLCGGIQVDSSPEHGWLLDHAAEYGWFHPAWAFPGGAGPHEPWHWEYAG